MQASRLRNRLGWYRTVSSSPVSSSHVGSRPIAISPSTQCDILHVSEIPTESQPSRTQRLSAATQHTVLRVAGPKGHQLLRLPTGITARLSSSSDTENGDLSASQLVIDCQDTPSRTLRSQWGLTRALAANAVRGVTEAFALPIRLVGVGYRATLEPIQQPLRTPAISQPSSTASSSKQRDAIQADSTSFVPSNQQLVLRLGYPRPIRLPLPTGISCRILSPVDIELSGQDKHLLGQFAANIRRWRTPEPYNGKGIFVGSESIRRKEEKKK